VIPSGAAFSSDRVYRYALWRTWGTVGTRTLMFIGLNPSTADETADDPTIRRCVAFAKAWGCYDRLVMANLFALRATDPREMLAHPDPIGPDNDAWLRRLANESMLVVGAWGVHGAHRGREQEVRRIFDQLHCLGTTKAGHPRHPLYLRADTQLVLWGPK
jgi:hypothetical protein